jgi:anti-repressor protein
MGNKEESNIMKETGTKRDNTMAVKQMNEIITVSEHEGRQVVDARKLHMTLDVGRDFSNWIKDRIEKYGFMEGRDYEKSESPNLAIGNSEHTGGKAAINYLLTLSMAKELAMVENNEKGREVRLYLIEIEEAWNSPAMIMARALQVSQKQIDTYQREIAILKPKAGFFDQVADSGDALQMRDVAGVLNLHGWGRNSIFDFLRKKGVLDNRNVPYREYQDRGYFRVIEQKWTDKEGETHINLKTLVYQKGVEYIRNLINRHRESQNEEEDDIGYEKGGS